MAPALSQWTESRARRSGKKGQRWTWKVLVRGKASASQVANGFLPLPRGANLRSGRPGGGDSSKQRSCSIRELLVQEVQPLAWVKKGTIRLGGGFGPPPRSQLSAIPWLWEISAARIRVPPTEADIMAKLGNRAAKPCSSPCWAASCRSAREAINAQPGGLGRSDCPMAWSSRWRSSSWWKGSEDFQQPLGVVRSRGWKQATGLAVCGKAIFQFLLCWRLNDLRLQLRPPDLLVVAHPWPPSRRADCFNLKTGPSTEPSRPGRGAAAGGRLSFFPNPIFHPRSDASRRGGVHPSQGLVPLS